MAFNKVDDYVPKYGNKYLNYASNAGQSSEERQKQGAISSGSVTGGNTQSISAGPGSVGGPGQQVNQMTGPQFVDENPWDGGGVNQALVTRGSQPGVVESGYGFRDLAVDPGNPGYDPIPEYEAPPAVVAEEDPFVDENPYAVDHGNNDYAPQGGWEVRGLDSGGSGYQVHTGDKWAPGNYNIAGDNWHGNRTGYEGSSRVQMGYGLTQVPKLGLTGIAANAIGEQMIGHDELADGTRITAGSFQPGQFSNEGGQDVSGGATGGDLGVDAQGNKVSLGYGYGQVDPSLAAAAGYTPQTGPGTTEAKVTGGLGAAPAPGSPEAKAQVSKDNSGYTGTPQQNKQEADREAEQQSGPGATAVTDSSGKPVRSSSGSIVTNGGSNNNNDSGGGGGGGGGK